jgi:hypothetical protein
MKSHLLFKSEFFSQDAWSKQNQKHKQTFDVKKNQNYSRAFLWEDATGTAMAGPLGPQGCQTLKKDNTAGPSVSRPRGITGTIKSCGHMTLELN